MTTSEMEHLIAEFKQFQETVWDLDHVNADIFESIDKALVRLDTKLQKVADLASKNALAIKHLSGIILDADPFLPDTKPEENDDGIQKDSDNT